MFSAEISYSIPWSQQLVAPRQSKSTANLMPDSILINEIGFWTGRINTLLAVACVINSKNNYFSYRHAANSISRSAVVKLTNRSLSPFVCALLCDRLKNTEGKIEKTEPRFHNRVDSRNTWFVCLL